jgi:hypothetical protein
MSRGVARPQMHYYVRAECSSEVGHATRHPYYLRCTTGVRTKCSIVYPAQQASDKVESYIPPVGTCGRQSKYQRVTLRYQCVRVGRSAKTSGRTAEGQPGVDRKGCGARTPQTTALICLDPRSGSDTTLPSTTRLVLRSRPRHSYLRGCISASGHTRVQRIHTLLLAPFGGARACTP